MSRFNEEEIKDLIAALTYEEEKQIPDDYQKPELVQLSEEEILEIHSKGLLTPEEWINEMKDFDDYCPFTNGCDRCKTFANCDDCLVDYANQEGALLSLRLSQH